MNNLKRKLCHSDVGKFKTLAADLKEISDVVDKKVVKNTTFNKLNPKANKLDKKILMQLL